MLIIDSKIDNEHGQKDKNKIPRSYDPGNHIFYLKKRIKKTS